MLSFGDLLASIEKFLFDVLTWVIFIPKMLFKILSNPRGVPAYVREELALDEKERFDGGMSPVFLYLFLVLTPVLIMQVTGTTDDVAAAGAEEGTTGLLDRFEGFVKSRETILGGLAALVLPLIMAFATEVGRGKPLTRAGIKPAFYIQCLYLSPPLAALWVFVFLISFDTADSPLADVGVLSILLYFLLVVWWWFVETKFIANERSIGRFKAFLLVLLLGIVIGIATPTVVIAVTQFSEDGDGSGKVEVVRYIGYAAILGLCLPLVANLWIRARRRFGRPADA